MKLNSCPFCGSDEVSEDEKHGWPIVRCNECGSSGPCIKIDRVSANEDWNRRVPHEAP